MKKIKKSKIALIIVLALIGIFLIAYIAFRQAYNTNIHTDFKTVDSSGKSPESINSDRINILVLGMEGTRTDMIMVATFDPKGKKLDFISIPRDTYVDNEYKDPTFKKINSVYEIPSTKGGVERLAHVISEYLGIPIHDYVMVDYNAVAKLTEAVGGIDVDIPFHMYYDDPYSKPFPLHIHFSPGPTHLNGDTAIGYLRWRHNNDNTHSAEGDVGRVKRQQDFMKKVLEKSLTAKNLPKVAEAVLQNVKTSLEFEQAMGLAKDASSMNPDDIHFYQEVGMPSYFNSLWYFVADKEQTQKLMDKIINGDTITDEDLNPTRDFESYIASLDRSSSMRRSNTGSTQRKNRISVEDTKLNETERNVRHNDSPIFTEEENQNHEQNTNRHNENQQINPDVQNPDQNHQNNTGENQGEKIDQNKNNTQNQTHTGEIQNNENPAKNQDKPQTNTNQTPPPAPPVVHEDVKPQVQPGQDQTTVQESPETSPIF